MKVEVTSFWFYAMAITGWGCLLGVGIAGILEAWQSWPELVKLRRQVRALWSRLPPWPGHVAPPPAPPTLISPRGMRIASCARCGAPVIVFDNYPAFEMQLVRVTPVLLIPCPKAHAEICPAKDIPRELRVQ